LGLSRRIALTIPTSTVNRVVGKLLEKGHIGRGYLGLGMRPIELPEDIKRTLHPSVDSGLIVVSVEPDGPAGKAGVLFGDVIVSLGAAAVGNLRDLQAILEPDSVGKTLPVSLIRGGKLIEVNVTIGERKRTSK
jgi:S1-C subfamily serine protease